MLDPSTQSIALYVNNKTVRTLLAATSVYGGDTGGVVADLAALWDEEVFDALTCKDDAYLTLVLVSAVKDALAGVDGFYMDTDSFAALKRTRRAVNEVPWDDTQLIDIG